MRWMILICCVVWSGTNLAQQQNCHAYRAAFQAETVFQNTERLDSALLLYRAAFDMGLKDVSIALTALRCATLAQDPEAIEHFMYITMQLGVEFSTFRNLWRHLGNGLRLADFESKWDTSAIYANHLASTDRKMVKKLKRWEDRDQRYRGDEGSSDQAMARCDARNARSLKKLTLHLGRLPYYSEIGYKGSEHLGTLFYHMQKDVLEFFIPYAVEAIRKNEFVDARTILYQLDRIGISEGQIYTVSEDMKIEALGKRTQISRELVCQAFGEWFTERHPENKEIYFVPIDPILTKDEVNRVRQLFCLDPIENKWQREPWLKVVGLEEFRELFKNYP